MELATVIGACTATVKDPGLDGRKLALVQRVDENGTTIAPVEVALDTVGAGLHSTVLLARGSGARQPAANRQRPVDLTVVAVVDSIHLAPASPQASTPAQGPATTTRTAKTTRNSNESRR